MPDDYDSMWEGRSPNAADDYRRMAESGTAPDNAWLDRLLGRRKPQAITSQPLPPMNPTDEGRFAPSPFSPPPAPPSAPKPASKLSSAADIGRSVGRLFQQPWQGEGDTDTFQPNRGTQQSWQGDTAGAGVDPVAALTAFIRNNPEPAERAPRVPIDMRTPPQSVSTSLNPFVNATDALAEIAKLIGGGNKFGGNTYGGNTYGGGTYGGDRYGGRQFGASAQRDPGETGGQPMRDSVSRSILPPTSDEGRGHMVQEDENMRAMQRLLKMAQMFERQGTGETGGTPGTENFQQNKTLWDLLKGGNKFGGNTHGGREFGGAKFGASAMPPIRLAGGPGRSRSGELPPYEGIPGMYASGGGVPDESELPQNIPLPMPHPTAINPQQQAQMFPPPPPPAPPQSSGGGSGGGGGMGSIASLLPMLAFLKEGGTVPGFMRGGYPELRTEPIRHFDSGGQSYVNAGSSSGRADDVDARLSPKEYVLDAETMSMLGDGNPDHGAKKMDQFRANVRKHKGKALAKGKFSPNAKNPAEYLIGNPMGDGLRRLGTKT